MTYADPDMIKDSNGIKCRLNHHDIARLKQYSAQTGEQQAVLVRDAVIEYLDRAGIGYESEQQQVEFEKRRLSIAVADRIRQMREDVERQKVGHGVMPDFFKVSNHKSALGG